MLCFGGHRCPPIRVANNISSLLQRVAGASVQEIDRLIAELQNLRETLSTLPGSASPLCAARRRHHHQTDRALKSAGSEVANGVVLHTGR
jgi:hypothetical protein